MEPYPFLWRWHRQTSTLRKFTTQASFQRRKSRRRWWRIFFPPIRGQICPMNSQGEELLRRFIMSPATLKSLKLGGLFAIWSAEMGPRGKSKGREGGIHCKLISSYVSAASIELTAIKAKPLVQKALPTVFLTFSTLLKEKRRYYCLKLKCLRKWPANDSRRFGCAHQCNVH